MDLTSYLLGKKAGGGGSGGITPSGTIYITENDDYDVTNYANASVNVVADGDTLTEFLKVRDGAYLCYNISGNTEDNQRRALQIAEMIPQGLLTDCSSMFKGAVKVYSANVPLFDTSNVTNMGSMFSNCSILKEIPLFNTSNVTNMSYMFENCSALKSVPLFDTSNVTNMGSMFRYCNELVTIPMIDTSKVANFNYTFGNCPKLYSIPSLDIRNATNVSSMFYQDYAITEIWIRNIAISLTVGSGTSWGHLITVDSLVHLIYELRDTSVINTLTVGSANLEKLANVYVKLIEITDDMRAEDDLVDEKLPFVVCESTDVGAMLISDYVVEKHWTLK